MDYDEVHQNLRLGENMPARGSTIIGTAADIADNPTLQSALQVLEALSHVGKAIPYVSSVFILLKVIIDLERRAQDVDAKCTDLIGRVTFMLSHLPALEKMKVVPETWEVIGRMNEVVKEAAALIMAYRKQSRLARRLNLSNRDKFAACAASINTCCSDLVISLQIYQTSKIDIFARAIPDEAGDILTRDIPVEAEDIAAETFVADHGSLDAVLYDRGLVMEFAQQQHLVMDDSVMEQISASISDSMIQYHRRLEVILSNNIDSAIERLRNLMYASEAEQKFKCVQCDKEFTDSGNGPEACSFHRGEYSSWTKSYPCCGTAHPCQFNAHRKNHHCDYPYGSFFTRVYAMMRYPDTVDPWTAVKDTNLGTDEVQMASIGQLVRWVSGGALIDENTLLISVGKVWYNSPYYFNTFTARELQDITKSVRLSRRTMIYRTHPDENEYAMAEWILSDSGMITGVRLTAKSATSTDPYVRECPIDLSTCTKSGDILTISEGGMRSYIPASPYILPATVRVGPEVSDSPARPVRTNFKTRTTPSLPIVLKTTSDPPLVANSQLAATAFDYFEGAVSVFNNHAPGSSNAITIATVSASFRLVGEPEYQPVKFCKLEDPQVPVRIEPCQSWIVKFQVGVPRTEEDSRREIRWWNKAFMARYRPVRIKLILEDIEGEQCSLVLEYVYQSYPLVKRKDSDLEFFFFDNPVTLQRYSVDITPSNDDNCVVKIENGNVTVNKLEKAVYKALQTGETEIDLEIGREDNYDGWEWKAWALIDLSCRRVYGFKILMKEAQRVQVKRFACLGYVLCPAYGLIINETRPISYAKETVTLPSLEPYPVQETVLDDTLDDFKPPAPPKASSTSPAYYSATFISAVALLLLILALQIL